MHQKKQPSPLPISSGKQLDSQNYKAKNKDEDADTVNTMHITDPFVFWPVWVFFPQVEVFRYLFPDSHKRSNKFCFC